MLITRLRVVDPSAVSHVWAIVDEGSVLEHIQKLLVSMQKESGRSLDLHLRWKIAGTRHSLELALEILMEVGVYQCSQSGRIWRDTF